MLRVIGIGDNVVDRYVHQGTYYPGGCSVNFAVNAARLGYHSAFLGLLARDFEGSVVIEALAKHGVDFSMCPFVDGETGICSTRFIDNDRVITDDNDLGAVKATPMVLDEDMLRYIAGFDVAHCSYFAFMDGEMAKLKQAGVPVVFDFADVWSSERFAAVCPHIAVAFFSGGESSDEELRSALAEALSYGPELAVSTVGGRGVIAYDGKRFYEKAPYNIAEKVKDTMGAGDAFMTGFITAYYSGRKIFGRLIKDEPIYYTGTGREDYFAALIDYALSVGNATAVTACMTNGAFGGGIKCRKEER